MSPLWLWAGAIALYGAFSLWYNGWRGPLTGEEIETYRKRFEASAEGRDPQRAADLRAFLESDDGGEFFMLNLIRLQPDPVPMPGSGEPTPARRVLEAYTRQFMPGVFRRAGHPAFLGRAAGSYLEAWGVEPDPGWSFTGIVRYRSRRDLMELATAPGFEPAHVYKIAAIANTLAFPVAPVTMFFGPRVWVALVLALLASWGQLALRRFG
jgi:hypothetical protein